MRVLALSHGLGASVLVGQRRTDDARASQVAHTNRQHGLTASGISMV
jgi:hypothetical protein